VGVQAQTLRRTNGRRKRETKGGRYHMVALTSFYIALRGRLDREEGQALVEYALILGLISVVAITLLTAVGTDVKSVLSSVTAALASAV
jgi:pilus assembly protein Flp/PilA